MDKEPGYEYEVRIYMRLGKKKNIHKNCAFSQIFCTFAT